MCSILAPAASSFFRTVRLGVIQSLNISAGVYCMKNRGAVRGMAKKGDQYYAVRVGRVPGIYRTWAECLKQVHKFAGAKHKKFPTEEEASAFVEGPQDTSVPVRVEAPALPVDDEASGPVRKRKKKESSGEELSTPVKRACTQKGTGDPLYNLYFDGGARGNPGLGGSGAFLTGPRRKKIWEGYFFQGFCTNNQAEYQGLVEGMKAAVSAGVQRLKVHGDSKIIIQQMQGNFQVRSANLRPMYKEVQELAQNFQEVQYEHVYREDNRKADLLANKAMDKQNAYEKWFIDPAESSEKSSASN